VLATGTALVVTAACSGGTGLSRQITTGKAGGVTILLTDDAPRAAVASEIAAFAQEKRSRVVSSDGSPTAVATAVKDGKPVDVVVLPAGPALERVRDELVEPPVALGTLASTPYWAAAVTDRGLDFVKFLRTAPATALLRVHGFTG